MNPRRACLILIAVLVLGLAVASPAAQFPKPAGAVNDFANLIPPESRQRLEALSREVLNKTGVSLVVATFKDIGGQDIETFSSELFAAWGIGKKGEDKGVLLLLALEERRFRIETGYGVEGVLPDGLVGRIMKQYILPYFRKGQFGQGFENGALAIAAVLAENAGVTLSGVVPQVPRSVTRTKSSGLPLGIIFIVIIFILFGLRGGRGRRGGFGGGLLPLLLLGSMMGGGRGFSSGGFGGFGGGFGGFGGGMSGGGGVSGGF